MDMLIKLFLTYAAISMFSGIAYVFVYGTIIGVGNTSIGLFILLWGGPFFLGISIAGPILLWKMWKGTLE